MIPNPIQVEDFRKLPLPLEMATKIATQVWGALMPFRRNAGIHVCSDPSHCGNCFAPHLAKIVSAILLNKQITFVLPAFPGKSPNLAKVLGPKPDMAETLALKSLGLLCDRIQDIYPPGACILICSDGRVFSDAVGMKETDVTDYQKELSKMIEDLSLGQISTFNLDNVYQGLSFQEMRFDLMARYGQPLEKLQAKVRKGSMGDSLPENQEAYRMYCGITRFLVEDSMHPGQTKSRTALQRECRVRAYEVIQRSNAWSELIEESFPEAVRLSIHPQSCASKKFGIRFLGTESWITPWHGVAVQRGEKFVFIKRAEAEALGAQLVLTPEGRPSHYKLELLSLEQGTAE